MNNDLISRSALKAEAIEMEIFQPYGGDGSCMGVTVGTIDCAPAVDAELVRHGRWIMRGGYIRCSECDAKTLWKDTGGTGGFSHEYEQVRSVHCHNCGAKMDGDVNAD